MNRQDASFSLIYFDLDRFKPVNDLWGHAEGDEVLKVFAGFLHQHLEPGEIAGRLGGDEFCRPDPAKREHEFFSASAECQFGSLQ
jgi:diguanylate cyclase (GGDEF)-like protein